MEKKMRIPDTDILPAPILQISPTHVEVAGKRLLYFGGCDYYRLSWHSAVRKAVRDSLKTGPIGVSASRKTSGNHPIYARLENELAQFFKVPAATLVPSGFITNLIVAEMLQGKGEIVLIDEKAHPSLGCAAKMLGAKVIPFKHRDAADVARKLKSTQGREVLLMTDSVFAHDGSVAPLAEYAKFLTKHVWFWVDDAHGAGVVGEKGRGAAACLKTLTTKFVLTLTLSKAFGASGGAILSSGEMRDNILRNSRIFAGGTPVGPSIASAALTALKLLKSTNSFQQALARNMALMSEILGRVLTFPVFALTYDNLATAKKLSSLLRKHLIHPPFIHYPGGKSEGYFRFALSSEHSIADVKRLGIILKTFHERGQNVFLSSSQ